MSPEQAEGVHRRALGRVFLRRGPTKCFRAIALSRGTHPVDHGGGAAPPADAARAGSRRIPPALDAIVTRCLEKDPAKRYPSAAELHAALEECRAASRRPAPSGTRHPSGPLRHHRRCPAGSRYGHMGVGALVAGAMGASGRLARDRIARRPRSARCGRPPPCAGADHHPGRSATRAADQRRDGPDHARDDACGSRRRDQELPRSDRRVAATRTTPLKSPLVPFGIGAGD